MSGSGPARDGVPAAERDRVLAAVDALGDELVELAARTVRAPSVSGREDLVAPLYAEWMESAGLEVRTAHVDDAALPAGVGDERDLDRRPNVYGWLSRRPGRPVIALNGHMDVVPAGDGWGRDPFGGLVADGRLWGRGAADMKGGLAAGLIAVLALREAGAELACDVVVQCVIAEETGGLGTRFALVSGPLPDAAIVLEPTECAVASAAGGMVPFVVETTGRAVHSSVPWAGANALERLDAVRRALAVSTRRRGEACAHPLFVRLPAPAPMSVGVVRAGDYWASVPDRGRMEGRLGVLPGETVEDLCREVERVVAGVAADEGCAVGREVALRFPMHGFPAWETEPGEPVVAALRAASLAVAGDERATAVTYGSDAGRFAEARVPVALFGPGSIADAHGKDEHVQIAQLHEAARVLAVALLECSARIAARPWAGAVGYE